MDNNKIWIAIAVAVVCLSAGFFFGGRFSSSVNYSCNGGQVSGGSTSIPQGSNSLSASPGVASEPVRFGAVSGTESFSTGGGFVSSNNTTTTVANTSGDTLYFQRTTPTSTLSFATSTCITTRTLSGTAVYWTVGGNGWASSTSATCQ